MVRASIYPPIFSAAKELTTSGSQNWGRMSGLGRVGKSHASRLARWNRPRYPVFEGSSPFLPNCHKPECTQIRQTRSSVSKCAGRLCREPGFGYGSAHGDMERDDAPEPGSSG